MSIRFKRTRLFAAAILALSLSGGIFADTLRLKDGSIIKGKIVSFNGGKFLVEMGEGSRRREIAFAAGEVESVSFDERSGPPQLTVSTRTASYEKPVVVQPEPVRPAPIKPAADPIRATGGTIKPIVWNIKVTADSTANGWTNTGWVVKKGQRVRVSGDGTISLGKGKTSPPSGLANLNDDQKLLKNVPTGALVAVIGDDNNDFIYVGAEREFTATRDGALFLGINEGHLEDNSGSYDVKVEILP